MSNTFYGVLTVSELTDYCTDFEGIKFQFILLKESFNIDLTRHCYITEIPEYEKSDTKKREESTIIIYGVNWEYYGV